MLLCKSNNQIIKSYHIVCLKWRLKIVLTCKKWITVRKKLFEIFLKTTDWKALWKFCVTIIYGL